MGHSQAAKAATRKRIVDIAARRFREQGLAGVALADIAQEASITTGAFYRHFVSREEMLAEAFDEAARTLDDWEAASPDLAAAIRNYLGPAHRDAPGIGCPVAALVNDIARSGDAARAAYTARVERMIGFIEALLAAQGCENPRAMAMLQFSAWVGATGFARAVSDPALSDQLLDKVARQLAAAADTSVQD
jgi:TetR/AcrR family transcriptional repressor of nem operon